VKHVWRVIIAVLVVIILLWFLPVTRTFIANLLFSVARNPSMSAVVGWGFEHLSSVLPLERVLITDKTIAFNHPRPTIFDLVNNKLYLEDIWQTAREVFSRDNFASDQYALLVNGGIRQDVKQVHFHLNGEKEYAPAFASITESSLVLQTKDFGVYQLTEKPLHLVLVSKQVVSALSKWQEADIQQLAEMELPLSELEQLYNLSSRGFSLIVQEASELEGQQLIFHITAGTIK
jgi:diadenosine tetraphosphate (Ap4A) HIT family hydrolase